MDGAAAARPDLARLLYEVSEVAAMTGWSRSHLYREMKADRLRYVKSGATRRIRYSDLLDYLGSLPGNGPQQGHEPRAAVTAQGLTEDNPT